MAQVLSRIAVGGAGLTAAASWSSLAWLVTSYPPSEPLALAAFYGLLFIALSSSLTLVAWTARRPAGGEEASRLPPGSLGHAMLFSSMALFGLWLQSLRMLTPLNAGLLLAVYAFIELTVLVIREGGEE